MRKFKLFISAFYLVFFSLICTAVLCQNHSSGKSTIPVKSQISKIGGNQEDIFRLSDTPDEIVEMRTRTSKQFRNQDGLVSLVASAGVSLNYFENGKWNTVKNEIKSSRNPSWDFENSDNIFKTYLSQKSDKGMLIDFPEGNVSEWLNPSMVWCDLDGNTISENDPASAVAAIVHLNNVKYNSVFPGIDAEFSLHNDGKKMEYIINNISALVDKPANASYLVFFETILIPADWTVTAANQKTKYFFREESINSNQINSILLKDASGKEVIAYSKPVFYEQAGGRGIDGEYFVQQNGNQLKVGIKVPVSWLFDTARTYPVVIDPTANYYNYSTYKTTGRVWDDGVFGDDAMWMGYDDEWPSNYFINSWAEFNLSTLPVGQTITGASLYLYKTSHYAPNSNNIVVPNVGRMMTRPSTYASNQQLYDDIFNAAPYFSLSLNSSLSAGWNGWDLLSVVSSIGTDMASSAGSWFALGFNAATTGTEDYDDGWGADDDNIFKASGYSSANRPYIRITYCTLPTANAGPDQTNICNTTPENRAQLAGNAPAGGQTGQWTVVSGSGTFDNATQNNTWVTCGQGTNVYKWTVTVTDGGCTASDNVQIVNNTPTVPNAGLDGSTCNGSYSLNANNPTYGTGVWTIVGGTGIFSNSSLYNSSVSGLSGSNAGTANTFRWTITKNGCSKTDDVVVTYFYNPTASVTSSPLSGCYNTSALTLNGNNPATLVPPATGTWSVVSGTGTFTDANLYNTTVTNVGLPTNTYQWTVSRSGCSSSVNVVVNNNSPSQANAGPDQLISGSSTTLQGNNPTQGTGTWTVSPSVGVTITSPNTYNSAVSGLSSNTLYTFTWTIAFGGCPNTTDQVTVFWDPGQIGFIIRDNLTNDGVFDQTNESNDFIMNGTAKFIYGGAGVITNTYTEAKIKIYGTVTYDGVIDNGKFTRTTVQPAKTFTIASSKTYKNGLFTNNGTTTLSASSVFENSGNWINNNAVSSDATSIVKFNGTAAQEVTSNYAGGTEFGNVEIINTVAPSAVNGVKLMDNMSIKAASSLTLTDGVVIANSKNLIINNTANTAVAYGGSNSTFTDSWVYGTSTGSLRRYLANASNGEYVFPVGSATRGNLALLNNNSLPASTPFYVNGYFVPGIIAGINTNFPANLNEGSSTYQNVMGADASEGVWSFTENGSIDGTYDLKLYFNGFTGTVSDGQFCILSRATDPGDGSTWSVPAGSTIVIKTAASGFAHRTGMNSFSQKGIGRTPSLLPVELIQFSGFCNNHVNHLFWTTASESNNSNFTLERSADAESFIPIASVPGAGTSNTVNNYEYIDVSPSGGKTYYKLKQTDFDGSSSYSGIIALNECQLKDQVAIFSEKPDEAVIAVNATSNGRYIITLFDGLGNEVQQEGIDVLKGENNHVLQFRNLASGIYYIKLTGEKESFSEKIFIR